MGDTRQRDEARCDQRGFLDRRVRILLEVAQEPTGRDSLVSARIFPCNQHGQFERVEQAELREVSCGGHGHEHVATLQRPLETRMGVTGRARGSSFRGPVA
jgi:hypothetical protein